MVGASQPSDGTVSINRVLTDIEVSEKDNKRKNKKNATTGASAAGARALAAQAVAFYFRAPVKAFFRLRVDYMAAARAINPRIQAHEGWSIQTSTPGLLAHAVRTKGWRFIPDQVIPPLIANVAIGAVLYTTYLQMLGILHPSSGESRKRVYPAPDLQQTFAAGMAAGSISSLVAAPLDALQVRFDTSDMLEGKYKNMWEYGRLKLREIGMRGVLAGWGLSFAKDALGYGAFFATFEYVKAQAFYSFVTKYYGGIQSTEHLEGYVRGPEGATGRPTIRPHWALEPMFLLGAGMSATVAQQMVHYPLTMVQTIHYARLETLDHQLREQRGQPARNALKAYRAAYVETLKVCKREAANAGSWRRWLFAGFAFNTLRQVPSTSAGLIIFEMVRRRSSATKDEIRIQKDGYEILLA